MTFNHDKLNTTGLSGDRVLGSNAEYIFLSKKENFQVFETARKVISKNKLTSTGTGSESTRNTIELTSRAAEIGGDTAIILNSRYYKNEMTIPVLAAYDHKIAGVSPIPIMVNNFPPGTGMALLAEELVKLSQHRNIIGVKDTGSAISKMSETLCLAAPSCQVLAGSDSFFSHL